MYPGDWFIRMDQNNEGRLYLIEGYPKEGHVAVHEHLPAFAGAYPRDKIQSYTPARLKQVIKLPRFALWYPKELLPKVVASNEQ
jgi:hypothetical protein